MSCMFIRRAISFQNTKKACVQDGTKSNKVRRLLFLIASNAFFSPFEWSRGAAPSLQPASRRRVINERRVCCIATWPSTQTSSSAASSSSAARRAARHVPLGHHPHGEPPILPYPPPPARPSLSLTCPRTDRCVRARTRRRRARL